MDANEIENNLPYFTGTEGYLRWSPLTKSVLTDGCAFVADKAQAYWLFDAIDSHLLERSKVDSFAVAILARHLGQTKATLTLDDGNDNVFARQEIPYTDFPLESLKVYSQWDGERWVHMLPTEY